MASLVNDLISSGVTSAHRLPTISATQALQDEGKIQNISVSFGLATLDKALNAGTDSSAGGLGGLRHGAVTEIYGPPGSGKTALCIQACVSALRSGGRVLWLDCCTCVSGNRIKEAILASGGDKNADDKDASNRTLGSMLQRLTHYLVTSLAELLAIISILETQRGTNLVIVDSLSTLFDDAFVRNAAHAEAVTKTENHRWTAGRKATVSGELARRLAQIATILAIPVLITSNMVTRIRGEGHAVLQTSMSGQAWEGTIHACIQTCRDWSPAEINQDQVKLQRGAIIRYASVTRRADPAGRAYTPGEPTTPVPFYISKRGVQELELQAPAMTLPSSLPWAQASSKKRAYAEVADSEDGASEPEFAWEEDQAVDDELDLVTEEPQEEKSNESAG